MEYVVKRSWPTILWRGAWFLLAVATGLGFLGLSCYQYVGERDGIIVVYDRWNARTCYLIPLDHAGTHPTRLRWVCPTVTTAPHR